MACRMGHTISLMHPHLLGEGVGWLIDVNHLIQIKCLLFTIAEFSNSNVATAITTNSKNLLHQAGGGR